MDWSAALDVREEQQLHSLPCSCPVRFALFFILASCNVG